MQASPEFLKFGRWFILDSDHDAPTLDQRYDFVLNLFGGEERVRLRQFLDRALREASDASLERLWKEADGRRHRLFHRAGHVQIPWPAPAIGDGAQSIGKTVISRSGPSCAGAFLATRRRHARHERSGGSFERSNASVRLHNLYSTLG